MEHNLPELVDAAAFLRQEDSEVDWLIDNLLVRGSTAELYGETGLGKSFMVQQIIATVITGGELFGRQAYAVTSPGTVLYVQAELTDSELRSRLRVMSETFPKLDGDGLWLPHPSGMFSEVDSPANWPVILQAVDKIRPDLIVLDPLSSMLNSADTNSGSDVKRLLNKLDRLRREYHTTILIVHHTRKSKHDRDGFAVDSGFNESIGSNELIRWAGTIVKLAGDPVDVPGGRQTFNIQKLRGTSRYGEDKEAKTTLSWNPKTFVFEQVYEMGTAEREGLALAMLDSGATSTYSEWVAQIGEELQLGRSQAYKLAGELKGRGSARVATGGYVERA